MKNCSKLVGFFVGLSYFLTGYVVAYDSADNLTVTNIRYHGDWEEATGYVSVGVSPVPDGLKTHSTDTRICFQFDTKTPEGMLMYSTLLSAKAESFKIRVWYQENTSESTNIVDLSRLHIVEINS